MANNRRDYKKLLINPDAQIRIGTLFLSMLLVFHLVVTLAGIELYMAWVSRANDTSGYKLIFAFAFILIVYAVFYIFAFILGLAISHKIYGPFVNIQRVLNRLVEGDNSERINLRKGDDKKVHDIAQAINRLADNLAKKS